MPDTASRVYGPAQPGTSNGTLYTVPASTTAIIKQIIVANTTTAEASINVGVNGTSATAANNILHGVKIPGNSTVPFPVFLVLATTDTLTALQGTASALTVTVSGVLIT